MALVSEFMVDHGKKFKRNGSMGKVGQLCCIDVKILEELHDSHKSLIAIIAGTGTQ